jgi:hypothetical protein
MMITDSADQVRAAVNAVSARIASRANARLETSRRLVTDIGDHATDLNDDGLSFAAMERTHVEKLQALHPAPESLSGSV